MNYRKVKAISQSTKAIEDDGEMVPALILEGAFDLFADEETIPPLVCSFDILDEKEFVSLYYPF